MPVTHITFVPKALDVFRNAQLTENDSIANMTLSGGIKEVGIWKGGIRALGRSTAEKRANNEIRTKFLEALGHAFGLESGMETGEGGKVRFSKDFMDKLERILGAEFKRSNFGINNQGEVDSGKPLTKRRIERIINAATLSQKSDYNAETFSQKLALIKTQLDKMKVPMGQKGTQASVATFYKGIGKIMNFVQNELDGFLVENKEGGEPKCFIKTMVKGKEVLKPVTSLLDIHNYVQKRTSATVHIGENILPKKHATDPDATLEDLTNPAKQITDYLKRIFTEHVTLAINLFFESELQGPEMRDKFWRAITKTVICVEGRTTIFGEFQVTNMPTEDVNIKDIALHDIHTPLNVCLSQEMDIVFNQHTELETWEDVAPFVKEKLRGLTRPIEKAVMENNKWKFVPVLDLENKPVIRPITDEDLDEIGPALVDISEGIGI